MSIHGMSVRLLSVIYWNLSYRSELCMFCCFIGLVSAEKEFRDQNELVKVLAVMQETLVLLRPYF
jgi:hypothetical protein